MSWGALLPIALLSGHLPARHQATRMAAPLQERRAGAAALGLLLVLACCTAGIAAEELRVGRSLGDDACENTQSGRWQIADDRGMVCPREAFDYATGCCSGGERHVCASCETADKCCAHFEHCVSCCLSPENEPEKHMHSIYRGRNKPETGRWGTPFEYCRAVCRTTARSTAHENSFIDARKHCFSKLGRPNVAVPPAPPLPHGVTLVPGGAGQSCDSACAGKKLACRPERFASLNDCNSLRAKFMCEAGCGPAEPNQKEYPGYIEGGAPKHQRPAYCATLPAAVGEERPSFSCDHAYAGVRRLCPCEPAPQSQPGAAVGGVGGEQQQQQQQQQQAQQQQLGAVREGGGALQMGQQQAEAAGEALPQR